MAEDRLNAWKVLFRRALEIIDAVAASGLEFRPSYDECVQIVAKTLDDTGA